MPLPWERNWSAPALPPEDSDVAAYIADAATKRGIPVSDALRVWSGEGRGAWQSNFYRKGKREESYGPYQLYKGGGLGNAFQRDTGLDPADPSTWKRGVDYALDTAKKEGWGQWYGAPPELRARGGYVDVASPSMGAVGRPLPWQRQWNTPKTEAVSEPSPEPIPEPEAPGPQINLSNSELADDVGRSGISGISEGLIGLAGAPGEIAELLKDMPVDTYGLGEWLRNNARVKNIENIQTPIGKVGDLTGYESKTPLGGAVATAGRAAPVAMGAASIPRAAAIAGGTGLATEVGQEVGGDLGGAGAGIAAATLLSRGRVPPKAPKPTAADVALSEADGVMSPGTAAIHRLSQAAYDKAEKSGVVVKGQPLANFLSNLKKDPDFEGIKIPGDIFRMAPKDIGVREFDDIRKKVVKVAMKDPDPNKRRKAGIIIDRLDDFFSNKANTIGNGYKARAALNEARKNWKTYRKSAEIDSILEVAKDRAGQFSVSGNENALRTGFRQLSTRIARDKRTRNLFTKDERAIIQRLSRGWGGREALRGIGAVFNNRMVQGGVLGYGAIDYHNSNDPAALLLAGAMWGAGKTARGVAGRMAKGEANRLSQLVRGGGQMRGGGVTTPAAAGTLPLNPYWNWEDK